MVKNMNEKSRLIEIDAAVKLLLEEKKDLQDQESERVNAANIEADRRVRQELDDLVFKYNREEGEQSQRLARIFHLIKQRNGPRSVKFSNGSGWVNDWHGPDRTDMQLHIDKKIIMITDIEPGV